jgi:hypothetical protein
MDRTKSVTPKARRQIAVRVGYVYPALGNPVCGGFLPQGSMNFPACGRESELLPDRMLSVTLNDMLGIWSRQRLFEHSFVAQKKITTQNA